MNRNEANEPELGERETGGPPVKLIALLVVAALLAVFIVQNGADAPIEFLWVDGTWPVWVVIGISVVVGIVLDRLFAWQWRRARRRKQREQG